MRGVAIAVLRPRAAWSSTCFRHEGGEKSEVATSVSWSSSIKSRSMQLARPASTYCAVDDNVVRVAGVVDTRSVV